MFRCKVYDKNMVDYKVNNKVLLIVCLIKKCFVRMLIYDCIV